MAYFPQTPGINFIQANQNQAYANFAVATIQQLKCNAKDALKHNDNAKALDAYNQAIFLAYQVSIPSDEFGKLLCNRSLVYYNLKDYRSSLADATQASVFYPEFYKGHYRQGLAYKSLNEPVHAVGYFANAIKFCQETNQNTQDLVACYAELINVLCEVEDILDIDSFIKNPESDKVKDLILKRHSSNGQWKAISYLLIGDITGADSKLAGSFSNCNCSSLSVLKMFKETSETQKREWANKLAIKLLQNGASFQEFENGLDEQVIHFGVKITLQTGNAEFLKYLLSSFMIEPSKINAQCNGDTVLHVLVKDLDIRKTTIGETIIGLLVNHGCRLDIKDNAGKTPVEYTSKSDQIFRLLQNASNGSTGRDDITSITRIRKMGKDALKAGSLEKALEIYTEGLAVCSDKGDLKNVSMLYTNRATVYSKLEQHDMALTDAESAIQADPTWHKAHWRKGRELYLLNKYDEAFDAFLLGCGAVQPVCDDIIDLLIGAVIAFPGVPENHKGTMYKQLFPYCFIQFWPKILNRLSKEGKWTGIRYLILGLSTEVPPDHAGYGVASSCDTSDIELSTVFKFVEETRSDRSVANWLTPTLMVLLFRHKKLFLNFRQNINDTCIHAAVKYALITGDVCLLEQMPIQGTRFVDEYLNGNQESPYHVITKNRNTQDCQLMRKVVLILSEKNFTASFRDKEHRLPIDYISKEQFGVLHDDLLKISGDGGLKTKAQLIEKIEEEMFKKDYTTALQACYSALSTFDLDLMFGFNTVNKELSCLLRNLSDCHLHLGDIKAAINAAGDSVKYNQTCYKAHYMLGNALLVNKSYEPAFATFVNALLNHCNSRTTTDISIIVEILKKICLTFMRLDKTGRPVDIQAAIPVPVAYSVWVHVLYGFILEKNLLAAKFIEKFMFTLEPDNKKMDFNLKPLCDMEVLEKFPECIYFIAYLIRRGCTYTTLSTQEGDTFINAAVRMTFLTGIPEVLKHLCHCLQDGKLSNITDCDENSCLHIAAAQKIEKPVIGRHEVIQLLMTTHINPFLKNKDGKYAIDLLPKEDKRSRKVLQKIMKIMSAAKDAKNQDHHGRESSPATPKKAEHDELLKQKQPTAERMKNVEGQINTVEVKCNTCQETFDKCKAIILEKPSLALKDLSRLMKSKHRHKQIEEASVVLIADFLAESTDIDIPDELFKIPQKPFEKIVYNLVEQEKWKRIYELVTKHNIVHGKTSLSGFASEIRTEKLISQLIKEFPNEKSSKFIEEIVHCFIRNGGRVDSGGQICITNAVARQWYNLLNTLICHYNCDPQYLYLDSCSTPIHSALILGLHKDPDKYARLDPKQRDRNGDTLFHLVVKETCNTKLKQVAELLQQKHVPCKVQNKDGKFPLDYLKASDPRYKILHKAMEYDTGQIKTTVKQKKANDEPTIHKPAVEKGKDSSVMNMERIKDKPKQSDKTIESKPPKQPKQTNESYLSQIQKLVDSISPKQSVLEHASGDPCKEIIPERIPVGSEEESEIDQMELGIFHGSLEGKTWEVECTSGVLKSLQSNRILPVFKQRIVKIINALASGIYSKSFFKPLVTGSERIKLFESKISSASRLIWEVGKQFSPRLTMKCEQEKNIYTDIIRIWEVVMEHKNIHQAVERIVKSHEKGASCLIQKKLCGNKAGNNDFNTQQNNQNDNRDFRTPNIYLESDPAKDKWVEEISFFPPASSKDTEYSTIKFYTFSSNVALNVLYQMKGEFPFRVTDIEYKITNLPFNAPIVLIGRSGTGKTTCCVYRLWYRFQQFWSEKIMDEATPEDSQNENRDHFKEEKDDITETCVPNNHESMNDHVKDEKLHAEIHEIHHESNGHGSSEACFDKISFVSTEEASNQCNTESISEANLNEVPSHENDKIKALPSENKDVKRFDEL
ncbi:unnamed protein product [Mytilus coruscus]|uniref:TPR and ankyrin repeat-containing protein 1 n=1 Tax=Mytilus coruscus TaxID=42192 RepID=A0A6J8BBP9_MYTCO|nr:unnamed protein product [Mytilus coruscus]